MGNQLIHIDFYILMLNGVDAVLGVNWLQTLGPILWDFKAKSMVFKQNGRVMELQGTDSLILLKLYNFKLQKWNHLSKRTLTIF